MPTVMWLWFAWTGYTLSYVEKGSADSDVVVVKLPSTSQNHTVTGLRPTTVYTVQLYASTRIGSGPSRNASVRTAVTPGLLTYCTDYLSRRMLVLDRQTFPVLCLTYSWIGDHFVGKLSTMGQPTWPTQPFILLGSINE